MNENLPAHTDAAAPPAPPGAADQDWGPYYEAEAPADAGIPWRRYVAALLRFKWLILLCVMAGGGAAAVVWKVVELDYRTSAMIRIDTPSGRNSSAQPIQSEGLLEQKAWIDLLKTDRVLADVVRSQRLYLTVPDPTNEPLFQNFAIRDTVQLGSFSLVVNATGDRWRLATREGVVIEQGPVGDSVGKNAGFLWLPPPGALSPNRSVAFRVSHPFSVARNLSGELQASINREGDFLTLALEGKEPEKIANVLNAVLDRYIEVAAELKREKLDDRVSILREQVEAADSSLREAEVALENFRVNTITLPSDPSTPITPGLQQTQTTAYNNYFNMKTRLEEIRRDRARLEQAIQTPGDTGLSLEALEAIPSVNTASQLTAAMNELSSKRAQLRQLRYRYTDDNPQVRDLLAEIARLEAADIPRLAGLLNADLQSREGQLQRLIEDAGTELREIPTRTITEGRLSRDVASAENLATRLRNSYEEASLAAASSLPDLTIVDRAHTPQFPVQDVRIRFVLMALGAGLGLGVVGALLLDQIDPRVRYPEQVTSEMGLVILGAVPQITAKNGKRRGNNAEFALESFRELRLNLAYAHGAAGPHVITLSSPGPGEGKSLITANLAVAFAELGQKTLIIDGDTRRGDIHQLLGRRRTPGLTDYLAGEVSGREIIQTTEYPTLHVIGSGSRLARAPELLGSPAMRDLLTKLRSRYDVILVDTPPLAAGGDAFILGALTGNMALVLRTGASNRDLTMAKMEPLGRLPIRILGAILNDITPTLSGYSRYYSSYLPEYAPYDEERPAALGVGGD